MDCVPVLSAVGAVVIGILLLSLCREIILQFRLYLLPKFLKEKNPILEYGGKWAVITGGSDGIGKGYAIQLAKRGMNICVVSNFENNIVKDIQSHGVECMWIDVDLSASDVFDKIADKLNPIVHDVGILINNVGIVQRKPQAVVDQDEEFFRRIINVNITATILMTNIVIKEMMKRDRGLIVNMGSLSSSIPLPFATMYTATKSFIETYSVCLACELRMTKVRVKCVKPAFVNTKLIDGMPSLTQWFSNYLGLTFPDAQQFAESAVPTFTVDTPICYNGYWSHSLLRFVIPFSLLGPERLSEIVEWFRVIIVREPIVKIAK
ncbi:short chain dehydrogenase [Nesidiocoris tenuis]|uniref:Short chain dehydrogenase n=1 Tax=Nesidiocoris tenuis TaxID=355587 RepID=A0ABN7B4D4_9HEMI|nr:short chain dehydrogenase [Nesidiocoris tenuis]